MLDKILLPLDGSESAEAALPYVRDLAGRLNAEIYLLHVCPPGHENLNRMHKIYLDHTSVSLGQEIKDVWNVSEPKIRAEVISGEQPAKAILDYIQQNDINLVAVTTCGASGIRVWAMGSVADKIVRGAGVPTLLIRVKGKQPTPEKTGLIRKILVPLDTSEASKIAVTPAVDLAKKLKTSITLFSMAETVYAQNLEGIGSGMGVGANWDQIDASTKKYLDDYLTGVAQEISNQGVEVNSFTVIGIDAASEILELEKKLDADLVVMATRGRSPIARWAFGSTAEKILREGQLPLLLVREKTR
jgi:nucleotide-binding universal stress UspA family protein